MAQRAEGKSFSEIADVFGVTRTCTLRVFAPDFNDLRTLLRS